MQHLKTILITLSISMSWTNANAQTCSSLFEVTSPLSRLSVQDQEVLTALAQKQVEITYRQDISNTQKQILLSRIEEQVQQYISENNFSPREVERFYANYRALVFEAELNLKESLTLHSTKAAEKKTVLDNQEQALNKLRIIQNLLIKEYKAKSLDDVLFKISGTDFLSKKAIDDFKLAISFGADVNSRRVEGNWSVLHLATYKNYLTLVKILIENHADIEAESNIKETPLQMAVYRLNTEIAEFLIEMKADVNTKDHKDITPLHWAVMPGNFQIAELLLKQGAIIDVKNIEQETPLQWAFTQNASKVARLFIEHGADVNSKDTNGAAPIHHAVRFSDLKLAELILSKGIDVNQKNMENDTPLQMALKNSNSEMVNLLKSYGATE